MLLMNPIHQIFKEQKSKKMVTNCEKFWIRENKSPPKVNPAQHFVMDDD